MFPSSPPSEGSFNFLGNSVDGQILAPLDAPGERPRRPGFPHLGVLGQAAWGYHLWCAVGAFRYINKHGANLDSDSPSLD